MFRTDCSSAKTVIEEDVKILATKQIFARWQAELSTFEFDIEYIQGKNNFLSNFLIREFLQSNAGQR